MRDSVSPANRRPSGAVNRTAFPFASGRWAMLIDGGAVRHMLRALGGDIDYRKLRGLFAGDVKLVRASYYSSRPADGDEGIRPLLDWLAYNGYTVHEKSVRNVRRVGVSLAIAVDALELAPTIDHLLLFSGDGDMAAMVESLQRKGVRVTAVSTIATRPASIANELRRQVDCFLDFRDLMQLVGRSDGSSLPNMQ